MFQSTKSKAAAAAVEPLLERIATLEDEAKRRRGGRPKGSRTKVRTAPKAE